MLLLPRMWVEARSWVFKNKLSICKFSLNKNTITRRVFWELFHSQKSFKNSMTLPWGFSRILGVPCSPFSVWVAPALGKEKTLLTALGRGVHFGTVVSRENEWETGSFKLALETETGQRQETEDTWGTWGLALDCQRPNLCFSLSAPHTSCLPQTSAPSPSYSLQTAIFCWHVTPLLFQNFGYRMVSLTFQFKSCVTIHEIIQTQKLAACFRSSSPVYYMCNCCISGSSSVKVELWLFPSHKAGVSIK